MRTPIALIALLAFCLALGAPALAKEADGPQPHADADVEAAFERFEQDYAADDMDKRLRILRWLGMYMHKDVVKELRKIWLKEADLELRAAAAEGLGRQLPFVKEAGKILLEGLVKYRKLAGKDVETPEQRQQEELEANVLVKGIQAIEALGYRPEWKKVKGFIDHNNDDVAIALIDLCAKQKEYKALPIILEWFHHYPDGLSWSGGTVKVDTGAAGNKDANAAKAKWKAKYGGRARKARPRAFEAMVRAIKEITGVEMSKQEELKAWMRENRVFLKRQGV